MGTTADFIQRLGPGDLRALAEQAGLGPGGSPAELSAALSSSRLADSILTGDSTLRTDISPRLLFAVAVHRAVLSLQRASFVTEWVGPRRRLPVFDVASLLDAAGTLERRLFLAELLTSFVRVHDWVAMAAGRRLLTRKRFEVLDWADLAEVIPDEQRPVLLRRLGDLSLFLAGVFPEAVASWRLPTRDIMRLAVMVDLDPEAATELVTHEEGPVALLEVLGARSYHVAAERMNSQPVVKEMADRFPSGRRFLSYMADGYLGLAA